MSVIAATSRRRLPFPATQGTAAASASVATSAGSPSRRPSVPGERKHGVAREDGCQHGHHGQRTQQSEVGFYVFSRRRKPVRRRQRDPHQARSSRERHQLRRDIEKVQTRRHPQRHNYQRRQKDPKRRAEALIGRLRIRWLSTRRCGFGQQCHGNSESPGGALDCGPWRKPWGTKNEEHSSPGGGDRNFTLSHASPRAPYNPATPVATAPFLCRGFFLPEGQDDK